MKSVKRRYFLGKGLGAGESIVMVCFSKSTAVLDAWGRIKRKREEQDGEQKKRFVNYSFPPLTRRCIQLSRW